jgi:hypothetical protein
MSSSNSTRVTLKYDYLASFYNQPVEKIRQIGRLEDANKPAFLYVHQAKERQNQLSLQKETTTTTKRQNLHKRSRAKRNRQPRYKINKLFSLIHLNLLIHIFVSYTLFAFAWIIFTSFFENSFPSLSRLRIIFPSILNGITHLIFIPLANIELVLSQHYFFFCCCL